MSQTAPCGTEVPKIIERRGALDGFLSFEVGSDKVINATKISREKIRARFRRVLPYRKALLRHLGLQTCSPSPGALESVPDDVSPGRCRQLSGRGSAAPPGSFRPNPRETRPAGEPFAWRDAPPDLRSFVREPRFCPFEIPVPALSVPALGRSPRQLQDFCLSFSDSRHSA